MTPIADMVEHMLSTGIPPETIVLAVRAIEEHAQGLVRVDQAATKRRAWDRDRKRRKAAELSTGNSAETENAPLLLKDSPGTEACRQGKEKRTSEEIGEGRKRARGTVLSDDWQPTAKHFEAGLALGFGRDQVLGMAEDMRLWAKGNSNRQVARKADWNATFSGWMRRETERRKPNGNRHAQADKTVVGGIDRVLAKLAEFDEPAGSGGARQGDVRMLPQR